MEQNGKKRKHAAVFQADYTIKTTMSEEKIIHTRAHTHRESIKMQNGLLSLILMMQDDETVLNGYSDS